MDAANRENIPKIIRLWKSGYYTVEELAVLFDMAKSTVVAIVERIDIYGTEKH